MRALVQATTRHALMLGLVTADAMARATARVMWVMEVSPVSTAARPCCCQTAHCYLAVNTARARQ